LKLLPIVGRRHSGVYDVRQFRATDCDVRHYVVVATVRERLAMNVMSHRFHSEISSLKKLSEMEGKGTYLVEISNSFAAFEYLYSKLEVNKNLETIRENITSSAK
jgi:hypothetical protein